MNDPLADGIRSLKQSTALLQSAATKLEQETKQNSDLVSALLQSRSVYELISEFDIERAQIDLNEELEPVARSIGSKLRVALNRKFIDKTALKRRNELIQGVLNNNNTIINNNGHDKNRDGVFGGPTAVTSNDVVFMASTTNEELEELKRLRARRSELQKVLDALEKDIDE